jgi:hypothetical protein
MPLLYGEGKHAFRRLQEEIMKKSTDQTLFLWHSKRPGVACGMLAPHPSNFVTSNYSHNGEHSNASFTISNRGLSIQLPVIDCSNGGVIALIGSLLTPDRIGHRFVTMGIPLRAIWKTNVLTYYRISDPIELSKGHFQRSTFRDLLISLTGQHPPSCWIRFRMAPEVWSAFDFNLMEAKDGQRLHLDKRWRPEDKWWERPPWSPLSKMHWYLIGSLNEYRLSNEYTNEEILLAASKSNPNLRMIIQFGLMKSLEVQEYGQVEPSPFLSCMTHFQIKKPGLKYKYIPTVYRNSMCKLLVESRVRLPGHKQVVVTMAWDWTGHHELLTADVEFAGIRQMMNRALRKMFKKPNKQLWSWLAMIGCATLLYQIGTGSSHRPLSGRWSTILVFAMTIFSDRETMKRAAWIGFFAVCFLRVDGWDINTVMHGIIIAYLGHRAHLCLFEISAWMDRLADSFRT